MFEVQKFNNSLGHSRMSLFLAIALRQLHRDVFAILLFCMDIIERNLYEIFRAFVPLVLLFFMRFDETITNVETDIVGIIRAPGRWNRRYLQAALSGRVRRRAYYFFTGRCFRVSE